MSVCLETSGEQTDLRYSWTGSAPRARRPWYRCRKLQVRSQERFHGEHSVASPHDALRTPPVLGAGDGRSGRQRLYRFVLPVGSKEGRSAQVWECPGLAHSTRSALRRYSGWKLPTRTLAMKDDSAATTDDETGCDPDHCVNPRRRLASGVTQTPLATKRLVLLAAAAGTPAAVAATRRAGAIRAAFATNTRREPTLATSVGKSRRALATPSLQLLRLHLRLHHHRPPRHHRRRRNRRRLLPDAPSRRRTHLL